MNLNKIPKRELIFYLNIICLNNNQLAKLIGLNLEGLFFYANNMLALNETYNLNIELPKYYLQRGLKALNVSGMVEECNFSEYLNKYLIDFKFKTLSSKQKDVLKSLLNTYALPNESFKIT